MVTMSSVRTISRKVWIAIFVIIIFGLVLWLSQPMGANEACMPWENEVKRIYPIVKLPDGTEMMTPKPFTMRINFRWQKILSWLYYSRNLNIKIANCP